MKLDTAMRPPFPEVWDSTMLSAGRSCPRKLELMYVEHWKPSAESVHLVAGGAFAAGLEAARREFYVQGRSAEDAQAAGLDALWKHYGGFECPQEESKSPMRVAGALEFYFSEYPLGADGAAPVYWGNTHGIEFSFAEPLPVIHPTTGEPLIFAGRADMVANAMGGLFLYDEKTTKSLGASWANQWEMRSQFTAYCWGMRAYGINPAGMVVRGVAILKEKYTTAQAITYRASWEVERWLHQTTRDLERFKSMWEAGYWDYNLDHACSEYGGCPFSQRVCKTKVEDQPRWLEMYFHKKRWDPLTRQELAC